MINIAICDDEIKQLDIMEKLINENLLKVSFSYQLIRFSKGSELMDRAQKDKLSAVFLDIDMPQMNGIDVARNTYGAVLQCWIWYWKCVADNDFFNMEWKCKYW